MASTRDCAGVTTYIKTELIADGIGRAHVPRIGGARNGMTNGQRVDHELRVWIDRGATGPLKHAGSRHVAAGLARLKIRPLQAQVRVTDPELKLTTLIDAVGEGPDNTLWIIEIKTTTLNSANHIASYGRVCRRTPVLRNGVTHTEQTTHYLQAAFGALTLRRMYNVHPDIRVAACVVVATANACRTYVCPDKFMDRRLFRRFAPVPLAPKRDRSLAVGRRSRRAEPTKAHGIAEWPKSDSAAEKALDASLLRLNLMRNRGGRRRSVWCVHQAVRGKLGKPVGAVALITTDLHGMTRAHRAAVCSKVTACARRLLERNSLMKAAARLTISARTCAVTPCPGPLGRV